MDTLPLYVKCLIGAAVMVGLCWWSIAMCIVASRADEQMEKLLQGMK